MKLNEHLENITIHKRELNEEELKTYSPFMISRFVSMSEIFLPYVNEINRFVLSPETHLRFMQGILPRRKMYFKYLSNKKKKDNFKIECLKRYFEISSREANEYLEILTNEQLKYITKKFHFLEK